MRINTDAAVTVIRFPVRIESFRPALARDKKNRGNRSQMAKTKKPAPTNKDSVIFRSRLARVADYEALLNQLLICVAPVGKKKVARLGEKLWRSIPQDTNLEVVHDVALTVAYVAAQALAHGSE